MHDLRSKAKEIVAGSSVTFTCFFLIGFILDRAVKAAILSWAPQIVVGNSQAVLGLIPEGWTIIGLVGWVVWLWVHRAWFAGEALVLAGGISNLVDRILWGQVVDYIPFFGWSVFNVADGLLVLGVGLVLSREFSHHDTSR